MEWQLIPFAIACVSTVVLLLVSAVAFFVMMFIKDVKQHTLAIAELTGRGNTHVQKVDGDIKLLTERTELQIQQLTKNVEALTANVKIVFENAVNNGANNRD